mmetsp:Transcript_16019/g.36647  ORF Transcript_16019/g.36647 Transcript_16019/m.36647 type:complete len:234 (+) Transcript_16019:247-948(+)
MTTINGVPINFDESWDTGIGGGLWTTGRAMGRYFDQNVSAVIANIESLVQVKGGRLAAIELGAGNGFLSVCLMALLQGHQHLVEVLNVTDLSDHLGLITKTVLANSHVWSKLKVLAPDHGKEEIYEGNLEGSTTVQVQAHEWGTTDGSEKKYDFIFGTDLAYRNSLHQPLIESLLELSHDNTVMLIGVTMSDTQPRFFDLLTKSGFRYEKLSDHLLDPEFRGRNFGIIAIQKR